MKLHEWLNSVIGTKVRDGQCVAFFRQFIQDVWGVPAFEGLGADGGAKDLFFRHAELRTQAKYSELITYEPGSIVRPMPGDAVIFKESPTNRWGHVAIFISDTKDGMLVAEQDGIAVMAGRPAGAKFGLWSNDRLLGWLRKRS